ncbi:MAG: hypothetical protein KKD44_13870 [Proteobacteria bacterium]|nr:hypothetical protein [Pseudomonadota bacterium]
MITKELLGTIVSHYAQNENGRHGIVHWARVLENGRRLCSINGARRQVVELFAVFHDSGRVTEKRDPGHGQRGADFALALRGKAFDLDDEDFKLLYDACVRHTDGETMADLTVQTCWDSDRLDLGRVNITPDPAMLCTEAAKEKSMIEWAEARSRENHVPTLIRDEWGIVIP